MLNNMSSLHDLHLAWKGHVARTSKTCHNSGFDGHIIFVLGGVTWAPNPKCEAQTGCHGNACCLSTGLRCLLFVAVYFSQQLKSWQ